MEFEQHHSGSATASAEQQRSSAFERLNALLEERVEIRWSDGYWYRGMLVEVSSDSDEVYGKISFDDKDFSEEFIRIDDIRPIQSINQSPENDVTRNAGAGAFDFESFDKYVRWILRPIKDADLDPPDPDHVLKMQELTLTRHAKERKHERFLSDRDLQEFHRAIRSKQDCLVYNQSLLVMKVSGKNIKVNDTRVATIIDVSEDCDGKSHFYEDSHRGLVRQIFYVNELVALMNQWNSQCGEMDTKLDSADLQLMRDNYSSLSYYRVDNTKRVTTTTSTFVFDSSFSRLITCYKNKISFGDWKEQQRLIANKKNIIKEKRCRNV